MAVVEAPAGLRDEAKGAQSVLVVEEGHALVFARTGPARRFLFRLDAPAILFGCGEGGGLLMAQASQGAKLKPVPSREFWRNTKSPLFGPLVERWVGALSAAAMFHLPMPHFARVHAAGPKLPELAAGEILVGGQDILWCRIKSGCGVLFDTEPVESERLLPLAPRAWLRAFEHMALACVPISELDPSEISAALASFQLLAEKSITRQIAFAAVDEMLRLARQSDRAVAETRRVHGDLGRMVGAHPPRRAPPKTISPLFLAVGALAERIGARAELPKSVREAEADSEPPLEEILRASSLRSRPLRLAEDWWKRGSGSFLGFRAGDGAPLALIEHHGAYVMRDVAAGTSRRVTGDLAKEVGRDGFALYQPLPDKKLVMRDLLTFGFQDCGFDFFTLVLAALMGAWIASVPSLLSRWIFDDLIPHQSTGLLIAVGAILVLLAVLRAVLVYSSNVAYARIRSRSSVRLKAALWDRLLRQPTSFITRFAAPDLSLRVNTAENVTGAIQGMMQQSLTTAGMLVFNFATMFWLSPVAAGVALGLMALFLLAITIAGQAQKRAFMGGEQAEGSVSVFVHSITRGVRKLRLAGAEDRTFVKWGDRFTRSRLKLINSRKVGNLFAVFTAGYGIAALGVIFAVLAWMTGEGVGVGTFFGFITAFGIVMGSFTSLGRVVLNGMFQIATIPYAQPLLDAVPEKSSVKTPAGKLSGDIEVSQLSFRYGPDRDPVLSNVSFAVAPGEFVAIVGASGSGKSTLVKLLLGFEQPAMGAVLYDRQDLKNLDADSVRRQVGTVLQRPQLMPTTLFENVRGISNASTAEVWDALALAGLKADVEAMPMGLHTLVAEGATGFSGGQLQRLAIARAVVRKPAILILDEATSALDNAMEREVSENLSRLAITRIVIAHRLSTIRHADRIILLADGRIAETGTFDDLVARGGAFAQLAKHAITL